MKAYTVKFDRIGRNRTAGLTLETQASDADDLADKIYRYARRSLASSGFEVVVDLEAGRGSIEYGRYGSFTIEERA